MVPPTRRTALQMLGSVGTAALAGCPSQSEATDYGEQPPDSLGTTWTAPNDEWRYPRGGLHNTAHSSTVLQERPTSGWQARGQSSVERESTHIAAVTQKTVVLATEDANGLWLSAYDAANGTSRWSHQFQHSNPIYPQFGGLVDGTLYLSDSETDVVAVDIAEGTVSWQVDLYERVAKSVPDQYLVESTQSREQFAPTPTATPDCVYVQTSYGVHGLAPEDGHERWRLSLAKEVADSQLLQEPGGLAITDERIMASYARPEQLLFGIRLHDGAPVVDRTTIPVRNPDRPLVTGRGTTAFGSGVIWSTDARGTLAAGAAGARAVAWQFEGLASSGAAAFSSLAADGQRVFACEGHEATGEFAVFALNADTGGLEWLYRESLPDNDVALSPDSEFRVAHPAVAGDTLLLGYGTTTEQGNEAGTLVALSTTTGTKRWRTELAVAPRDIAPTATGLYISGRRAGLSALGDFR